MHAARSDARRSAFDGIFPEMLLATRRL